ncbi:hypothetical protein V6N13_032622 [Hibiscus sabdariffa]
MEETWRSKREELCYWFSHIEPLLLNEVDVGTLQRKRLDVARITIRVASPLRIPERFNVVSMGVSYLIKVKFGKLSDECVHPVPGNVKEIFADEWSRDGVGEGGFPVSVVNETCDMLNTLVGIIRHVNLESIDPPGVVRSNQNLIDSIEMVPEQGGIRKVIISKTHFC